MCRRRGNAFWLLPTFRVAGELAADRQARASAGRRESTMAWNTDVRLSRPGLTVQARVLSTEVLECMPFSYHEETPVTPYWSQSVAKAEVSIRQGTRRVEFEPSVFWRRW